ncbi:MAG: indolepyruvate ferredoxin oxidoreductase family protein [Rhodocyclaceae bacterium]|nr:indolepyruvate ferredoxin oxidoreductase family protein [Rhodocyclaceae bacterium]MBL0075321.1 indolepyruvate ferredoxin oxidoreductase family protein [Rhodocyclaceae bacterium]MBP6108448.1 indolepyruvate ferredoxin oxidoreductase family protein [Rhodocyclaceae bacterium]MBP6278269.1 indolepyruvate ferredoxin oxidoreductase family protein [Rhodocyclaceae bacterium]
MNAPLRHVSLNDKYALSSGRVYLTGTQALVRLLLLQHQRDVLAGINTGGFVSGYRGSPLGSVDQALFSAKSHLSKSGVVFQPGINEDLAATAVWGTQQVNLYPGAKVDGVYAMWYGKGPGVDRSGDVFRHANAAGSSKYGGVLVIAGDDHAAKSSTLPHQTDHFFKSMMMPVLAPSGVQEYLDYGVHGWALSRYSGCWVAFKALADTVETSASVDVGPERVTVNIPVDFELPPDGLNIRWPDPPLVQEKRLLHFKLYAALAYCRANHLNRIVIDTPNPRLGIITSGKSYLDVRQALDDLGIDEQRAAQIGIRLYKIGMVWPLEAEGVRHFAEGLEEILVVEEKRQLLEYQLKEELYNWRMDVRPRVVGKFDEKGEWSLVESGGRVDHGKWLLPAAGELTPAMIARAIASRIARFHTSDTIVARLAFLEGKEKALASKVFSIDRVPTFCPGCPHNTSTKVPEGSRAVAGIGCHYMVTWMPDRDTATFSHMGGEGVSWVGQSAFTETKHIFSNLGDGTYFHSGLLAIRQSIAAKVNITYKLLYNDAVAMTGGQSVDGTLTVPILAAQLAAEGIHNMVVVTDGTERAYGIPDLPHGTPIRHRDDFDAIQREFRELPGTSAIIFDQTCAAEKRRRRKRGTYPDLARRMFINEAVCEGCGDCGVQSNCTAIVPVETEFGRKRAIDQNACNKDYSCAKGFCPSFVSVVGGKLRKNTGSLDAMLVAQVEALPSPVLPSLDQPYGILITGVGGTGVITVGALIGMAAHIDGKGVTVLDMAGLAQKGGSVYSHVRVAEHPEDLHAVRIAAGEADALIGADLVVSASDEALAKIALGKTRAIINSALSPTSDFTRNPDWLFPRDKMQNAISDAIGQTATDFIDAQKLATTLIGDAMATNLFMLGYAWQKGLVPVSAAALLAAIELNGTAIKMNIAAFNWGRCAAHDFPSVWRLVTPTSNVGDGVSPAPTDEELVAIRSKFLTEYQDAAYAERYRNQVDKIRGAEAKIGGDGNLTKAVARNLFKLMAIKDEYEVARLYAETDFASRVAKEFEGDYKIRFHLAPPLLAKPDPHTGNVKKMEFGPWMMTAFRWMAKARKLRGSVWDIFGRTEERRLERDLLADYEATLVVLVPVLSADNIATATKLAELPATVRGYGHVKLRSVVTYKTQREALKLTLGIRQTS